jgi:DNA-binding YbaB/EbfC family protein
MSDAGQIDFRALAQRAQQMQRSAAGIQQDIAGLEATGYAADGGVAATVSGEGKTVALRLDPSVVDANDPETLAEHILAAIDSAFQAVTEQRAELMAGVTSGLSSILDGLHEASPRGAVMPRMVDWGHRSATGE